MIYVEIQKKAIIFFLYFIYHANIAYKSNIVLNYSGILTLYYNWQESFVSFISNKFHKPVFNFSFQEKHPIKQLFIKNHISTK